VEIALLKFLKKSEGFLVFGKGDFPHGRGHMRLSAVSKDEFFYFLGHAALKSRYGEAVEALFFGFV
jgi:hypothetical protein